MKRLFIAISTVLILSAPVVAQRKPTHSKRTYARLTTRRDSTVQLPASLALNSASTGIHKATGDSVSTRQFVLTAIVPKANNLITASGTTRTSPEVPIQAQHVIRSYYVDLAYNKTVSIIFPSAVRSVDLGSRSIMADKAADVENVLKVKASQIGFNETNFSVMTTDGKFYSFIVNYNETPAVLALNLAGTNPQPKNGNSPFALNDRTQLVSETDAQEGHIQFAGVRATQSDVVYASDRILRYRGRGKCGAEANKMEARLRGLYVKDNVLYYRLAIENKSNLNYDIDYVRCFIVDSKTAKLTSRQEIELQPIYVHNEAITTVHGHQKVERVYAFQRFTIPNSKQLLIMIGEQNGGRELTFPVQNKDIMKARPL